MDIDEWEFLSDDGYLDFNEEGVGKQSPLGKGKLDSKGVFDMEYFGSSPPPRVRNQLVPLPIQLEPRIGKTPEDVLVKDMMMIKDIPIVAPSEKTKEFEAVEADRVKVFFKIKESEFVDMKMDSPKSISRGILPPMDAGGLKFEDKGEAIEIITSPRRKVIEKDLMCDKEEESTWEEENNSGFNIWKWSLTGVGAICSFGVAAATICVLFFGSQQRNKLKQDQKIRFQIYTDDKRIKQVVQHATKLNDAISAARGVPMSRAHITVGGYYDGL
ncbi:uncharacterized protein LOC109803591 [Cajanus cajan]|uniref:DUF6821 domain-containing protein n=1 Tax=Cajanus cajan TaxID=3821 RepID=A0A151T4Z9_CAJCA|nr:uncharacterized protein LOC109803591 [Cajanus cajan]KYP62105.1 hypothetical protein KK1_016629 [Cajanus cajan]